MRRRERRRPFSLHVKNDRFSVFRVAGPAVIISISKVDLVTTGRDVNEGIFAS
jgi:hypothetical protein